MIFMLLLLIKWTFWPPKVYSYLCQLPLLNILLFLSLYFLLLNITSLLQPPHLLVLH